MIRNGPISAKLVAVLLSVTVLSEPVEAIVKPRLRSSPVGPASVGGAATPADKLQNKQPQSHRELVFPWTQQTTTVSRNFPYTPDATFLVDTTTAGDKTVWHSVADGDIVLFQQEFDELGYCTKRICLGWEKVYGIPGRVEEGVYKLTVNFAAGSSGNDLDGLSVVCPDPASMIASVTSVSTTCSGSLTDGTKVSGPLANLEVECDTYPYMGSFEVECQASATSRTRGHQDYRHLSFKNQDSSSVSFNFPYTPDPTFMIGSKISGAAIWPSANDGNMAIFHMETEEPSYCTTAVCFGGRGFVAGVPGRTEDGLTKLTVNVATGQSKFSGSTEIAVTCPDPSAVISIASISNTCDGTLLTNTSVVVGPLAELRAVCDEAGFMVTFEMECQNNDKSLADKSKEDSKLFAQDDDSVSFNLFYTPDPAFLVVSNNFRKSELLWHSPDDGDIAGLMFEDSSPGYCTTALCHLEVGAHAIAGRMVEKDGISMLTVNMVTDEDNVLTNAVCPDPSMTISIASNSTTCAGSLTDNSILVGPLAKLSLFCDTDAFMLTFELECTPQTSSKKHRRRVKQERSHEHDRERDLIFGKSSTAATFNLPYTPDPILLVASRAASVPISVWHSSADGNIVLFQQESNEAGYCTNTVCHSEDHVHGITGRIEDGVTKVTVNIASAAGELGSVRIVCPDPLMTASIVSNVTTCGGSLTDSSVVVGAVARILFECDVDGFMGTFEIECQLDGASSARTSAHDDDRKLFFDLWEDHDEELSLNLPFTPDSNFMVTTVGLFRRHSAVWHSAADEDIAMFQFQEDQAGYCTTKMCLGKDAVHGIPGRMEGDTTKLTVSVADYKEEVTDDDPLIVDVVCPDPSTEISIVSVTSTCSGNITDTSVVTGPLARVNIICKGPFIVEFEVVCKSGSTVTRDGHEEDDRGLFSFFDSGATINYDSLYTPIPMFLMSQPAEQMVWHSPDDGDIVLFQFEVDDESYCTKKACMGDDNIHGIAGRTEDGVLKLTVNVASIREDLDDLLVVVCPEPTQVMSLASNSTTCPGTVDYTNTVVFGPLARIIASCTGGEDGFTATFNLECQ